MSENNNPPWQRTLATLGVMAGSFAFQETAVLPALPTIQRQMAGSGTTQSALLESGFLIVAAVAAPLIGKLGDLHGKKHMLLVTLAVYFVGAIGAGLAPNFVALVIFRALQGVGGALFSLSFAIMRDEAPDKLSVAIGWLVGSFGVGACLGLGLAGELTQALSWRYIFFAEGVLIVIGGGLVAALVPRSPERTPVQLDWGGVAWLGAALACLIMGLTEALLLGWAVAGIFILSIALFVGWVMHERRTPEPLLAVSVLTNPRVLLPNIGSAFAGYVAFSTFFLVPRFVQAPAHLPPAVAKQVHYGFGAGVVDVGLFLLPVGVGMLLAGPSGGILGRRYGGKWPFTAGLVMLAVGAALLALVNGAAAAFAVWLFVIGAGFGLSIGAAGVFITQTVDIGSTGVATAFNSLARLIAGGIGAQIAAALIKSESLAGTQAPHRSAFALAFGIAAFLALVGAAVSLFVPSERD
ncbi:MAG TPA: MFS transporter [Gammaproteobacteria bacterium]|nr:MFS transporter [Gammaproteobacteria bacterium]